MIDKQVLKRIKSLRLKGKKCILLADQVVLKQLSEDLSARGRSLTADINLEDSKKLSEEIGEGVNYIKCDVRLEDDIISVSACGIRLMCWLTMLDLNSISPMIR